MNQTRSPALAIAPPDDTLQITLLGPPGIVWQGRLLRLGRRQSRALLYRVAAEGGPVPRDQLCFVLWPDVADSAARRNLSVLLSHLKTALPLPDALVVAPDSIALDQAIAWSDAVVWDQVCAAALREQTVELLQSAVALYRGPFLDGFDMPGCSEYQAWLDSERQAAEWRVLQLLDVLAEAATAAGDVALAIAAAVRYLSVDPLAEEQHRRLMQLYAAMGDRAAALRQWQQCVAVLQRELGVEPLPETLAVYHAVREGSSPTRGSAMRTRLVVPGAAQPPPGDARPLDATNGLRSALPAAPNGLIGRTSEVAQGIRLVTGSVRLLTLTGPGGAGKTRLALELGHAVRAHFADGVVWIPLASLTDADMVADSVAQACALPPGAGAPIDGVRAWMRDKQVLLVIDNFEHLLPAAPLLAELLAAAPRLHILVTSRARLALQGEHILPVAPLPLPHLDPLPPIAALAEQPAVALLVARAQQLDPSFGITAANAAELAAICVRLDGLPLAIELAAVRLKLLGARQLLRRLEHRLALLAGGARDLPPRHQTLRATLVWSCELLPGSAQRLFARLAVFAGGCSLEAVTAVCGTGGATLDVLAGLDALIDHSLVQANHDGTPRFTMLETIREYASERLEAGGEADTLRERHAAYFRELVHTAETELLGPRSHATMDRLEQEYGNLLRAWDWLVDHADADTLYRLARPCFIWWFERGHWRVGAERLEQLLACTAGDPSPARAVPLVACATLLYRSGRMQQGSVYATEGYDYAVRGDDPIALGMAAMNLSQQVPDGQQRLRFAREAVAALRPTLQRPFLAAALGLLGDELRTQGDLAAAHAVYSESLDVLQAVGDTLSTVNPLGNLGRLALLDGDVAAAQHRFAACVAAARQSGNRPLLADWLLRLGTVELYGGRIADARAALAEALALATALEHQHVIPNILAWLALVDATQGALERASTTLAQSLDAYARLLALAPETPAPHAGDGARPDVLDALAAAATVHVAMGRAALAAVALGCAARIQTDQKVRLDPPLQEMMERVRVTVHAELGEASFRAQWTSGATNRVAEVLTLLARR